MRYFAIFAFLLSTILSGTAYAETESLTVPANRTSGVGGFYIYTKSNCYSGGKVDYKVTDKPEHGKVSVTYERRKIGESGGRCAGRQAGAMVVRYTPNRGYRGKDRFSVAFYFDRFAGGGGVSRRARNITYSLNVK